MTYQRCTEKKCCAMETDACYQHASRPDMVCRPLAADGSCISEQDWLCPGSDTAKATAPVQPAQSTHLDGASAIQLQPAAHAPAYKPATATQPAVMGAPPPPSQFGSPLVIGLISTAGAIVLLVALIALAQKLADRQVQLKRAGRGPAGSARIKTKHTKLRMSEADSGDNPAAPADNDDEEEILGDDDYEHDDAEASAGTLNLQNKSDETNGGPSQANNGSLPSSQDDVKGSPEVVGDDEDILLKRVHSLLGDLPLSEACAPASEPPPT